MPASQKSQAFAAWSAVLGCAAGVAAYVFLWHLPCREQIAQLKRTHADHQSFVERSAPVRGQIERLTKELEHAQQYCQQWLQGAPREEELTALFGRIHYALRHAGASVTRLEPMAAVPRYTLRQVPLKVVSTGSFKELADALVQLEELPGTVWIEDLALKPARENGTALQCEAKLVVFAVGGEFSGELDRNGNR